MKKIVALLLVICMVFGLVACKKKPVETPDGTTGSQAATQGGSNNNQGGSDNNQGGSENNDATTGTEGNSGNGGSSDSGSSDSGNANLGGGGDMGGGIIGTGYTGGTLSNEGGSGLGGSGNAEITSNDDLINPAFAGKTLQVYGFSGAQYDYIEDMGKGNYIWMVRAAIDEWAALNKVNIVFEGDYDQNTLLGAINSGAKPDVLLDCSDFPVTANMGIVRALTDAEYKQLADTCGNLYLDMVSFKGKSYGFNMPWAGNTLFYYNKTMFEDYGVKTPKEYYKEGNWTWETLEECLNAITKDLDGDGAMDTYGSGTLGSLFSPYRFIEAADGSLSHTYGSEKHLRYLELTYAGEVSGMFGAYSDCTIATSPRPGTHLGDAEWYNFEHLNQTLVNGDVVETIFPPTYDGTTNGVRMQYTPAYMSIFTTCDEPEAALSLMTYILRVGMRYMSEYSCGLYGCNYEGIRGVTEYSLGWRTNFQAICEERKENFDALGEDWDQEVWDKMYADIMKCDGYISISYPGDTAAVPDTEGLPPASALPIIKDAGDSFCEHFNSMYLN